MKQLSEPAKVGVSLPYLVYKAIIITICLAVSLGIYMDRKVWFIVVVADCVADFRGRPRRGGSRSYFLFRDLYAEQ